jgi:septal ring-binding cell division protein DamX
MPYTLQVAAYLKSDYAKAYVNELKAQDLEAFIVATKGKDKIWYQVRISRFATKADAITFGEQLITDGVIGEYYVANASPPGQPPSDSP